MVRIVSIIMLLMLLFGIVLLQCPNREESVMNGEKETCYDCRLFDTKKQGSCSEPGYGTKATNNVCARFEKKIVWHEIDLSKIFKEVGLVHIVLDVFLGDDVPHDLVLILSPEKSTPHYEQTKYASTALDSCGCLMPVRLPVIEEKFYWSCEKYPDFEPKLELISGLAQVSISKRMILK